MKYLLLIFVVVMGLAGCSTQPAVLTTVEAKTHVGREARVRGQVFTCHACQGSRDGSWKICLDAPCGSEPFAVILKPEVVQALGEEKLRGLEGKTILAHGQITEYKGRPEIVLHCPACLEVVP